MVPVELSERFVVQHPNARLVTYPSGHELVDVLEPMWEQTRSFYRLLGRTDAQHRYMSQIPV